MYRCLSACLAVALLSPMALAKAKPKHMIKSPVHRPVAALAVPINTASLKQWLTLPGVGAKRAKMIVNYREKHGPFHAVKDLLKVPGVGRSRLAQWQEKGAGHAYVILRAG